MINSCLDIPLTKVKVRRTRFFKSAKEGELIEAYWHSIVLIQGQLTLCNIVLDNGSQFSRVPLSELFSFSTDKVDQFLNTNLNLVQPYDAFGYNGQVNRHSFLRDQKAVTLKSPSISGRYLFTVNFFDPYGESPFSEFPEQHKTLTFIEGENIPIIVAYPNNFIRYTDKSLFIDDFDAHDMKVQPHEYYRGET